MNARNYHPRPKKRPNRMSIILVLLGTLCAVGAVVALAGYYILVPVETSSPLVLIREPYHGEDLTINEPVIVRALARDKNKITRIEFWANGRLLETQTSSLPGGASPMPLVVGWQPATPGQHTLTVRAFNSQEQSGDASIVVTVAEIPMDDADNDTIPDVEDACPEEAGPEIASGCPDADRDGITDGEDACPDEIGPPEADGCPAVADDDRDGDGVPDAEDVCLDEVGLIPTEGCPDRDGDLVADAEDACPEEAGRGADGCPEPIAEAPAGEAPADDAAPPVEGDDASADDAPPDGADPGLDIPDSDDDGMSDDADPCPFEAGTPEDGYCPPEDALPAPIPDGGSWGTVYSVEFDALSFEVDDDYSTVNCYVRAGDPLTGLGVELYEFEPSGDRRWNLEEQAGGVNSRMIWITDDAAVPDDGQLGVQLDCFAFTGAPGGMVILGRAEGIHGREDWGGQVHTMTSEHDHFTAEYRLCSPDCELSGLPAPRIHTQYFWLGRERLTWAWYGAPEAVTGFMVYVDGARVDYTANRYIEIEDFLPACGETRAIEVTAALVSPLETIESPHSNTWLLEGEPCPRIARVTFQTLNTYDLPNDSEIDFALGPVSGSLIVNDAYETFDTSFRNLIGDNDGTFLVDDHSYSVLGRLGSHCQSRADDPLSGASWRDLVRCLETDVIDVGLERGDSLTIRGFIYETDPRGDWYIVFNGQITLPPPPEGATGGTYIISDDLGYMDLIVQVELLHAEP